MRLVDARVVLIQFVSPSGDVILVGEEPFLNLVLECCCGKSMVAVKLDELVPPFGIELKGQIELRRRLKSATERREQVPPTLTI